ncbi:MAG TPA: DUF4190 domain-containing protein [Caulobacteraceae bacterium]|nr:DUF4190 domain-containing protein [Caulobacteraceae bacterium]
MTDQTSAAAPTPSPAPQPPTPIVPATNGVAVAALVLGILALFFFWIPFLGWIPVLVGLVLGFVALQQPQGRGMAIGGIVCAGIAFAIKIWLWVMVIGLIGGMHAFHHHPW